MNTPRSFFITGFATILALTAWPIKAQEATPSPVPLTSERGGNTTEEIDFASPDGKFAFLITYGDGDQTIDLIDKKTEKVVQHMDDPDDLEATSHSVLWAPGSKRFALMTRMGHPNQEVTVYFQKGDQFEKIKIPELSAEIPARIRAGKMHPHITTNNWESAEKWNKDGSLVVTIDNTIDGDGHTASAVRTVTLGFDKSGKVKILKSTVKYASKNDDE